MRIWRKKPLIVSISLSIILGVILIVHTVNQSLVELAPQDNPASKASPPFVSYLLPTEDGDWVPRASHLGDVASGLAKVNIEGLGEFTLDTQDVRTVRSDIFQKEHFSVFDILVRLHRQGGIKLDYHFDKKMDTHIIDAINGKVNWWYKVKYAGGWFETNAFRMDMYPYKEDTEIQLLQYPEDFLETRYRSFRDEVMRPSQNAGHVVIPEVKIGHKIFTDVKVTAHNLRVDVFKPDIITALDLLLSLAEQGQIQQLKLTWYEYIGHADPIDAYFVEQIDVGDGFNASAASGNCGWVYETGPHQFHWFSGNHIHLPSDVRVIISPEYATWFWICV